ncbi:peptidyl-prolyl cis-trans isomerase [Mangrovimicrobium sediminis]|uniref:Peptidyl-prolyl cis-trans isomerase n=1 Tax=Mangrovimicrobium sediminis TaxID=2562682 RepID=A0A4Z0LYW4_9GAMM|nr:peptidylprolyl isomerase [Haliea sp. SAOS-164]TGD72285.1 peptidyl-prolyl cis-trans isomerase [Haliea sp. SAOS-164]
MRRLLREPLLHFLLLGAGLFALYGWVNPNGFDNERRIVVDGGRVAQLSAHFQRTWNRAPTAAELAALVDNFVVEEIFYREALALGLDSGDDVVRRRLRQKMEFLTTDAVALYEPAEDELQAFLAEHPERFRREARYTFEQLYFSPDAPGAVRERAGQARRQLLAGDVAAGDPSLLPANMQGAAASQVDRSFGQGFAAQLEALTLGQWSEPIGSGLGLHLVRLDTREPAYLPPLAEVRATVEREWREAKNAEVKAELIAQLKREYEIVIEPDAAGVSS